MAVAKSFALAGPKDDIAWPYESAAVVISKNLPKSARLLNKDDYARVFAQSCRVSDQNFVSLGYVNHLPYARLGLAISIKQAGNAVQRNRIKRQIREEFRHHKVALAGLDVVILGRLGLGKKTNPELRASLCQQWETLDRRCKRSCLISSDAIKP